MAPSFRRLEEGWYTGRPSPEALKWAVARQHELDRIKPNDFRNFSNRRWQGFLAELAFARWLGEQGAEFEWNGGADPDPDLIVLDTGVSCKSRGFTSEWRPNFVVNMFERHRKHPEEQELFFTAVQRPSKSADVRSDRVLLLGGISHDEYFLKADEIQPGQQLNPYEIAENHVWNLECHELERPDEWLARLRNGD